MKFFDKLHTAKIIAWLFLAVLIFPSVIQAVHIHHTHCCTNHGDSHDGNNCPVCQFTFLPYIAADTIPCYSVANYYLITIYFKSDKIFLSNHNYFYLRAPPFSGITFS